MLSYILNECLLSINPFYDTSQVLIMIWSSVHRIMTINFIGCVITLVIPSSLAMFTFKKIYLKFYLLCLVEVSLNPPSPPKKKVCKSQKHFYTTLCYVKLIGLVLLSFLVRLIRVLNYCMHYCLEIFFWLSNVNKY